eukprot:Platyproteum_vivax@DN3156_c0_g1_i1.p1
MKRYLQTSGKSLKRLKLCNNPGLGNEGLSALFHHEESVVLRQLLVASERGGVMGAACGLTAVTGGKIVQRVLSSSGASLEKLCLEGNDLGNLGLLALLDNQSPLSSLRELNVSKCGLMGEEGGKIVGQLVQHSAKSLQILQLAENYTLGNHGLVAFCDLNEPLPQLIEMDLTRCGLKGAKENTGALGVLRQGLEQLLKTCCQLRTVGLSSMGHIADCLLWFG